MSWRRPKYERELDDFTRRALGQLRRRKTREEFDALAAEKLEQFDALAASIKTPAEIELEALREQRRQEIEKRSAT